MSERQIGHSKVLRARRGGLVDVDAGGDGAGGEGVREREFGCMVRGGEVGGGEVVVTLVRASGVEGGRRRRGCEWRRCGVTGRESAESEVSGAARTDEDGSGGWGDGTVCCEDGAGAVVAMAVAVVVSATVGVGVGVAVVGMVVVAATGMGTGTGTGTGMEAGVGETIAC